MSQKNTLFLLFHEVEKYLSDHVECHVIFHDKIEKSELNNFLRTSTSQYRTLRVVEVSKVASS
jgi:hypothetical protein